MVHGRLGVVQMASFRGGPDAHPTTVAVKKVRPVGDETQRRRIATVRLLFS